VALPLQKSLTEFVNLSGYCASVCCSEDSHCRHRVAALAGEFVFVFFFSGCRVLVLPFVRLALCSAVALKVKPRVVSGFVRLHQSACFCSNFQPLRVRLTRVWFHVVGFQAIV
jgi:hypothetical protein